MIQEKTSYSVPEIMQILGISKTSAYALVKTEAFKTVIVGKKIRVLRDGFERWLDSQQHYTISEQYIGGGK
jgi:hypothetical protein